MWPKRKSDWREASATVTVARSVVARIGRTLAGSQVEEGGKLLGSVTRHRDIVHIDVKAYIDSGPRVSKSETHLMPDGEYQGSLLELLQCIDPDIDHIGSWHSHHCNGLQELSSGDISGYYASVNNRDYNLDHFLALLVTQLDRHGPTFRVFLFERNASGFFEVPTTSIRPGDEAYVLDGLLVAAEQAAFARREASSRPFGSGGERRAGVNEAQRILAEDRRWILARFPSAQLMQSKRTQELRWLWRTAWDERGTGVTVEYVYPSRIADLQRAMLIVRTADSEVLRQQVMIADGRFQTIEDALRMMGRDQRLEAPTSRNEADANDIQQSNEQDVERPHG